MMFDTGPLNVFSIRLARMYRVPANSNQSEIVFVDDPSDEIVSFTADRLAVSQVLVSGAVWKKNTQVPFVVAAVPFALIQIRHGLCANKNSC